MVGFGYDNEELGNPIAPFLLGMTDNLDHELRVVVGASVTGEPAGAYNPDEWPESMGENIEGSPEMMDMACRMRGVWASTEDVWEIDIDGYVLFMERDESYTTWDEYELYKGKTLIVFERSRLLDDLEHYTFAFDGYPGPLTHYAIYCEDHLIDVVTNATPVVRKLTPEEIRAWGIEEDEGE